MRAQLASIPATPGRENEDFAAVTSNAAVVIDGAGTPAGSESGCMHGVAWYSNMLGASFIRQLANEDELITACLSDAIRQVASRHASTCDLDHPGSPSATVTAIRGRGDTIEYLVLADSPLILDLPAGPKVICDDREAKIGARFRQGLDATPNGSPQHARALRKYVELMRGHRNRDNGFWVASADPSATNQAITGAVARHQLRGAALLSDGASRVVDRFHLMEWPQAMEALKTHGPSEIIRLVREAENSDPQGARWPRGKKSDDATIIFWQPDSPN